MNDISGNRFGKLVAIEKLDKLKWKFKCDCGNEKSIRYWDAAHGKTTSCGCHRDSVVVSRNKLTATRGGITNSYTGKSWSNMMTRCYNKNNHTYAGYGAIGVSVCEFIRSSPVNIILLIGERPKGLSIDRVDNLKHYSCGSCKECFENGWTLNIRWSTTKQQNRNQRRNHLVTIRGVTHCVAEWAEIIGINEGSMRDRLKAKNPKRELDAPKMV